MSIQIIYNEAKNEQFTFSSVNREKIRKNMAEHFIIKFHPNFFSSWYVYYTSPTNKKLHLTWLEKKNWVLLAKFPKVEVQKRKASVSAERWKIYTIPWEQRQFRSVSEVRRLFAPGAHIAKCKQKFPDNQIC